MPTPSLVITLRRADSFIDKLHTHKADATAARIEPKYQYFIAEMIMLRLFSIFEHSVAEIAFKLASGARYTNGNQPILNAHAKSMAGARTLFLSHARPRTIQNLKWTTAHHISNSVQHVIPTTESFLRNARAHGAIIDEMRRVRNVLAHNSTTAKNDYLQVVRQSYGANIGISVGKFLTTARNQPTCKIERYILSTKIILAELARGQ